MSKQTYRVVRAIHAEAGVVQPGQTLELTDAEAAPLKRAGAIQLKPASEAAPKPQGKTAAPAKD